MNKLLLGGLVTTTVVALVLYRSKARLETEIQQLTNGTMDKLAKSTTELEKEYGPTIGIKTVGSKGTGTCSHVESRLDTIRALGTDNVTIADVVEESELSEGMSAEIGKAVQDMFPTGSSFDHMSDRKANVTDKHELHVDSQRDSDDYDIAATVLALWEMMKKYPVTVTRSRDGSDYVYTFNSNDKKVILNISHNGDVWSYRWVTDTAELLDIVPNVLLSDGSFVEDILDFAKNYHKLLDILYLNY